MANKKINELNSAGTVATTDLIAVADPSTGIAEKAPLSDLPFIPKGGTENRIPKVTSIGTLTDSKILETSTSTEITDPVTINALNSGTGLSVNMGDDAVANNEQYAIDVNSNSIYSSIRVLNGTGMTAGGYAGIELWSQTGIVPYGFVRFQAFIDNLGNTVQRTNNDIKFVPSGRFIVGNQTGVNFGHLYTMFPNGNIRMDNGTTDPGVKLLVGGAISMPSLTVSNIITASTTTTGFARFEITNTSAHAGAASGVLFINNVGSIFQLYAGSQTNLYAPDGALIRTSGVGPLRFSAAGVIEFGRMAPSSPDWTLWGKFFGNGNLVLGGVSVADSGHKLHVQGTSYFTEAVREVVVEYADNAAAIAAGLPVGKHYRTGDILKIRH